MKSQQNTNPILPAPGVSRTTDRIGDTGRPLVDRQNEVGSLNQLQHEPMESNSQPRSFLRCRNSMKIATFNVNTIRNDNKKEELAYVTNKHQIEIIGIQEHRIIHNDEIEYRNLGDHHLITSSAWRNNAQASQGGVGLLLGSKARKALLKVHKIHPRILVAEFAGNPESTVMAVYSLTNCSPENEVEEFYNILGDAIQRKPAHNFLIVLGDFNARLGPEDALHTYHSPTNKNGSHLVDSQPDSSQHSIPEKKG